MAQVEKLLTVYGACVVRGFGGVGKSTLLALYAHKQQGHLMVWWLPCENVNVLLGAFELLAAAVGISVHNVRCAAGAEPAAYCRALVGLVCRKLSELQQGALVVMDNVEDAALLSDFLHHRP